MGDLAATALSIESHMVCHLLLASADDEVITLLGRGLLAFSAWARHDRHPAAPSLGSWRWGCTSAVSSSITAWGQRDAHVPEEGAAGEAGIL